MLIAFPADREVSASRRNTHVRIEHTATYAGHDCRAGTGSTRGRFAYTALPHAQPNVSAIDDLHVSGIHALREARMVLDRRPLHCHRRRIDVVDNLHRVRI